MAMSIVSNEQVYTAFSGLGLREVVIFILGQTTIPLSPDEILDEIKKYDISFYPTREKIRGILLKLSLRNILEWVNSDNIYKIQMIRS